MLTGKQQAPILLELSLALAVATISGALISQFVFGLVPCELCLQQRLAYYIGIPVLLIATIVIRLHPGTIATGFVLLGIILFLWSTWMAGYHAGVEWGFWPGPTSCTGALAEIDFSSLLADMKPVVPCDVVQFRFLGISLAGYNALLSIAVVGMLALSVLRSRKPSAL